MHTHTGRYVPDVGEGFHSVQVVGIAIGSSATVAAPQAPRTVVPVNKAAILDTGTNILLVPGSLLKPLQAAM